MGITDNLLIFLVSLSPVLELRGAIPLGFRQGIAPHYVFFLALLGNIGIIIPLLVLFRNLAVRLEHQGVIGRIISWWFARAERKSKLVKSYGFWGLVFLVAIPLPGTGAWTGAAAATLLKFKLARAFGAICLGVVIAGILVAWASWPLIDVNTHAFSRHQDTTVLNAD